MRKWVTAIVVSIVLLGACARSVESTAVAEPTRWDPCSITPEQIEATGLDPEYRDIGWGRGIVVKDWDICSFKPLGYDVPYFFVVRSSLDHTIDEERKKSSNFGGRTFDVDGRDAFQYETKVASSADSCHVAVDLVPGLVVFTVNDLKVDDGVEPCPILLDHVADVKKALPLVTE